MDPKKYYTNENHIKFQNVLGIQKLKQRYKTILEDPYLNLILTCLKIFQGISKHFMIDPVPI